MRPTYEELAFMIRRLAGDYDGHWICRECDGATYKHQPDCDLGKLLARLDESEPKPE